MLRVPPVPMYLQVSQIQNHLRVRYAWYAKLLGWGQNALWVSRGFPTYIQGRIDSAKSIISPENIYMFQQDTYIMLYEVCGLLAKGGPYIL